MSSTTRDKMDEFNAKLRVLLAYGYFDNEMNILFKGKVAQEIISTDKILTTELIFSGLLKELTIEECVALITVLYPQVRAPNNAEMCMNNISERFMKALQYLHEEC